MKDKRSIANRVLEDRAFEMTERLACSPPEGDDWEFVSMSNLSGEFRIEAVAQCDEPHFIRFSLGIVRGMLATSVVCCPHDEELVERILGCNSTKGKKAPARVGRVCCCRHIEQLLEKLLAEEAGKRAGEDTGRKGGSK